MPLLAVSDFLKSRVKNNIHEQYYSFIHYLLTWPPSVRNWYCMLWSPNAAACWTLAIVTAVCSSPVPSQGEKRGQNSQLWEWKRGKTNKKQLPCPEVSNMYRCMLQLTEKREYVLYFVTSSLYLSSNQPFCFWLLHKIYTSLLCRGQMLSMTAW